MRTAPNTPPITAMNPTLWASHRPPTRISAAERRPTQGSKFATARWVKVGFGMGWWSVLGECVPLYERCLCHLDCISGCVFTVGLSGLLPRSGE